MGYIVGVEYIVEFVEWFIDVIKMILVVVLMEKGYFLVYGVYL